MKRLPALLLWAVFLPGLSTLPAESAGPPLAHWPRFRGPDGRGVAEDPRLPRRWGPDENVAWRVPIPGRSWSSPVVWGDRVFITTAVSSGEPTEPKKGLYLGGNRDEPLPDEHRWLVLALDLDSGRVLWKRTAARGKPEQPIHRKNTYASETPVTDGKRVYAYFGSAGLFAYTLDGEPVWKWPMEPAPMRHGWGSAASPVVHAGRVFVVNDNEGESWIAAFDAATGDEIWRRTRDEGSNWSTPLVWETPQRTEIVTAGTDRVRSYGLDGKLLWELDGMSSITIGAPYAAEGLLYVSSGFVADSQRPLWAIEPGAEGTIRLEDGEASSEHVAWVRPRAAPYNPTTIVYRGLLYTLMDRGFLACYEARTGKTVYGKQRLGAGGGYTASPWAYRGRVFCLNEDGETTVVEAGREFRIVGRNSLGEMCMATPAVASGRLLIRSISHLWCLQEETAADAPEAGERDAGGAESGEEAKSSVEREGASPSAEKPGYALVWRDEFEEAGAPDPAKWTQEEGFVRNRELQYYTRGRRENARVEDGCLVIEARKERYPNPRYDPEARRDWRRARRHAEYTSASVTTRGRASWKHVRVELRAKVPRGRGVWPALWMLGDAIGEVGWPACGEIDILEYVGFEPHTVWANVHTEKYNHVRGTAKGSKRRLERPWESFHVWALDWTRERLVVEVDGEPFFTFRKEAGDPAVWPFDRKHYLILNLAIGGSWGGRKGVDDGVFPQRFLVDWVRVYERRGTGRPQAGGASRSPVRGASTETPVERPHGAGSGAR